MRIITKRKLIEFYTRHPEAKSALEDWYQHASKANWEDFSTIKAEYSASVDYVGNNRYVFNIKGNNFRLIVIVLFTPQIIYIRFVGTHAEYDKIKDASQV